MGTLNWALGFGATWIIDITTGSGSARAYFQTAFPADQASLSEPSPVLTSDLAAAMATALQSAVEALGGVTAAAVTAMTFSDSFPGQFHFPAGTWAFYATTLAQVDDDGDTLLIDGWYSASQAWLVLSSPADGILTQDQADSLAASLTTAFNATAGVTGAALAQATFTPATA